MTAQEYRSLIKSYVDGKIPVSRFEKEFFKAFRNEPGGMEQNLFYILDNVFAAVEAYDPDTKPEEDTLTVISEETLRKRAAKELSRLDAYLLERKSRE